MAQINFTGNIGADAELRWTQSGRPVLNFQVYDSKSKRNDQGDWDEITKQVFRCALWGPPAEWYAEALTTGTRVKVSGEFYSREYETRDGAKGLSLDVDVEGLHVYPPRRDQAPRQSQQPAGSGWGQQDTQQGGGWGDDSTVPF